MHIIVTPEPVTGKVRKSIKNYAAKLSEQCQFLHKHQDSRLAQEPIFVRCYAQDKIDKHLFTNSHPDFVDNPEYYWSYGWLNAFAMRLVRYEWNNQTKTSDAYQQPPSGNGRRWRLAIFLKSPGNLPVDFRAEPVRIMTELLKQQDAHPIIRQAKIMGLGSLHNAVDDIVIYLTDVTAQNRNSIGYWIKKLNLALQHVLDDVANPPCGMRTILPGIHLGISPYPANGNYRRSSSYGKGWEYAFVHTLSHWYDDRANPNSLYRGHERLHHQPGLHEYN